MLKDRATRGERLIEELLKRLPKEEFFYFVEPWIVKPDGNETKPDFVVVMRHRGVIIVEVKDWVRLEKGNQREIYIRRSNGAIVPEKNPLRTAQAYAHDLTRCFEQRKELCHRHMGKMKIMFPWVATVALPHISMDIVKKFEESGIWTPTLILGREKLASPETLREAFETLYMPFELKTPLNQEVLNVIRGVIDPEIIVKNDHDEDIGTLTLAQEALMKEPVPSLQSKQMSLFDEETLLSQEAMQVSKNQHTRLVRGVAGSGKTLVLMHRARHLVAEHPDIKMLVMSFNVDLAKNLKKRLQRLDVINFHKVCSQILRETYDGWKSPNNSEGWLQRYAAQELTQLELEAEYVSDEIGWRKDMGLYDNDAYLKIERRGRGQSLSLEKRQIINRIFDKYLKFQETHHWIDWDDVPHLTLEALEEGHPLAGYYDVILIDEAQDFAPTWISIVKKLLRPDGSLFVCDDPTQSLSRYYSWKEKGLEVVGRTRILRVPFRCTRQINLTAYSLIASDPQLNRNEDITRPDLDSNDLLDGEKPVLLKFSDSEKEVAFTEKEIDRLLSQGVPADQIAVLCHNHRHVKRWVHLRQKGHYVESFEKMKGLEFTAVFVPSLHSAFINETTDENISIKRRKIFTAMTRARHTLMLSYQNELPKPLEPILKYVTHENAG